MLDPAPDAVVKVPIERLPEISNPAPMRLMLAKVAVAIEASLKLKLAWKSRSSAIRCLIWLSRSLLVPAAGVELLSGWLDGGYWLDIRCKIFGSASSRFRS
jgi:hypothetical protein